MLEKVKLARKISTDAYDEELRSLISAGFAELARCGIIIDDMEEPEVLVERAVITYVAAHFGTPPDYDRLMEYFNIQVKNLKTSSLYTDWGL